MDRLLGDGRDLADGMVSQASPGVTERLSAATTAGLRRLDEDRDLSRLLFRGLGSFPELLQRFGDGEINRFHRAAADMLTELAGDRDGAVDWAAIAVVLQGATTQYWLLTDLFGQHPTGVDEDRFVRAVTTLTAALIANSAGAQPQCDAAIAESPDTQVKET